MNTFNKFILINNVIEYLVQMCVGVFFHNSAETSISSRREEIPVDGPVLSQLTVLRIEKSQLLGRCCSHLYCFGRSQEVPPSPWDQTSYSLVKIKLVENIRTLL